MPYCLADGFAQYLLIKLSSKGGGETDHYKLNANNSTTTHTYTFTSSCSKVTIALTGYLSTSGGGFSGSYSIKVNNTTKWSKSVSSGYLAPVNFTEMVTLSDINSGDVITFTCTGSGEYYGTPANATLEYDLIGQAGGNIERNLLPNEIKPIGKQTAGILY